MLDTGWDVLAFARQASDLAGGKIEFLTIPTDGAETNASGDVVLIDPDAVRNFVAEHTGARTTSPSASTAPENGEPVSPADLTVEVRNGTGRSGLAARVAEKLSDRGYLEGTVTNSSEQSRSSVHYPPGELAAGDQLARVLGGMDAEEDATLRSGRVRVYLGSDFSPSDIERVPDDSSTSARPSAGSRRSVTSPPVRPPPPITADGVPCVD